MRRARLRERRRQRGTLMRLSIRWRQLVAAPLAALALGAWISKEDAFKDLPLGKEVSNPLSIGKVHVPLPEGEWVVVGRHTSETGATGGAHTAGGVMGTLALADILDGKLRGYIRIYTTLEYPTSPRWTKPAECSRGNMLFVQNEELPEVYSFFCWSLNHSTMHFDPKTGNDVKETSEFFKAKNVGFPDTMLAATFYMSIGAKYLRVKYYKNPEIEGIPPSQNAIWNKNDWHKSRIHQFPDKARYAEKMKIWATGWREKVKADFDKEP